MITQVRSRLSRALDVLVLIMALASVAFTVLMIFGNGWHSGWTYVLAIPATAWIMRFPVHLDRAAGFVEIGLATFILAFLAVMLAPQEALVIWIVGSVLGQLLTGNSKFRVFNGSLMIVSGSAAVATIDALRGSDLVTPREMLAVAVGFTVYFLVDLVISEVSLALDAHQKVALKLMDPGLLIALAGYMGVDSLGYLAALVDRSLPGWVLWLLMMPILTMLLAASSMSRERETARRMKILLDTSTQCQTARQADEVLNALHHGVRAMVLSEEACVRSYPPRAGEVGRPLTVGDSISWLVVDREIANRRNTSLTGTQGMEMLASFGDEALARLGLTAELTYNAGHDVLTGLANRAVFLRRVESVLDSCRDEGRRMAVMFCDLDGFKSVNDWFGHYAGDQLLIEVSQRLASVVGPSDLVARLGGDEFAVLVHDVPPTGDFHALTDAMLRAAHQQFSSDNRTVTITTSIGAAFSDGQHTADQLVRNADIAMYEAKFEGKNHVVEYHPALGRQRVKSLEMADSLREAIENRDLYLAYQPVVQSSTGQIMGLEALCRWDLRGEGIRPDVFIKIAEETGLITSLGSLVLDLLAEDAPALADALGETKVNLAVNVSAPQLGLPEFPAMVLGTRERLCGLGLLLEITERQVVSDDPLVLSVISQLEASEIPMALDDFGVGFSSIGYLQQLAVQILKIDRRFVEKVDTDPRSVRLLVSMVEMARALDLEVVIEGIERQSQVQSCWEALGGFDDSLFFQGFLYGRPMPLAMVCEFLSERIGQDSYAL